MKISVIIPTYKPQDYLWECLDSLCNQTIDLESFEVILVLNGCNEPYNSKIIAYKETHKMINWQYIQTNQSGVSNARNIALDTARGDYITFIDDDDYISPSYLYELYCKSTNNCVAISNTVAFYDVDRKEKNDYVIAKEFAKCKEKKSVSIIDSRRYFAGPVRKMIHKDIIGDRRFDILFKNGEDSLFMFLISDRINAVSCSSKNALYYRRLRTTSANMHQRNFYDRFVNSVRLIIEYTKIYNSAYNKRLYIFNVLGAIKTIFVG